MSEDTVQLPVKSVQRWVWEKVAERGYVTPYSPWQLACRQAQKMQEELGELAYEIAPAIYETGAGAWSNFFAKQAHVVQEARSMFDRRAGLPSPDERPTRETVVRSCKELADVVVVALTMAEALDQLCREAGIEGYDVLTAAMHKAGADVQRGVRPATPGSQTQGGE